MSYNNNNDDYISNEAAAELLNAIYERQVKRLHTIIIIQAAIIAALIYMLFVR